jgi:hypothetical protein
MTGGLLQLKAYGSENVYLNANPQISFFRSTYRRHTNFAIENYQLNFQGTPNLTDISNTTFKFPIGRYADLLGPIYLVIRLPAIYSNENQKFQWIKNIGSQIVDSAVLYIGGNKIQELRGSTIHQHHRIRKNYAKNLNYNEMIGHTPEIYDPKINNTNIYKSGVKGKTAPSIPETELYVPLCFYFTENSGSYLPLIALQKTEVEIYINLRNVNDLYTFIDNDKSSAQYLKRIKSNNINTFQQFIIASNIRTAFNIYLDATYIFLDVDERKQFADLPHEYLIEQTQFASALNIVDKTTLDMKFFHPTKELLFYLTKNDINTINNWTNYGNVDTPLENYLFGNLDDYAYINSLVINDIRLQAKGDNWLNYEKYILKTAKLLFDGIDRTKELDHKYLKNVMAFQYHLGSTEYKFNENEFLYNYSFSLEPDMFQPSGSCNLTNLKMLQLQITTMLPPIIRKFLLIYAEIIVADTNYCIEYRNPNYNNDDKDTVFDNSLIINSLNGTSLFGRLRNNNIIIDNVNFTLDNYGIILDNKFDLNGSNLKIYDDNWEQTDTFTISSGSIIFTYTETIISQTYTTNFLNMNTVDNNFSIYSCDLTLQDYNEYISKIPNMANYNTLYKTVETNINQFVKNLLRDVSTVNNNIFNMVSVDFINKKIYGIFNLLYNEQMTNFYGVITYISIYNVYSDKNKTTYIAILANDNSENGITLYNPNYYNLEDVVVPLDPIINPSLIIFSVLNSNNINIDKKKNYLWNYNLNVEAINYNILRIVSGSGAIVYAG